MTDIADQLEQALGTESVLRPAALSSRPTSHWNAAPMQAKALVRPDSTEALSRAMAICFEAGQSVVTHGGLTNCVTAAESTAEDVVVSLERMNRVLEIDAVDSLAVVEAGAILQTVQEAAAEQGLRFPLDLGARGSCTIGGNIATNAGGLNVLRYGMVRDLVLGLEAVLADGTVVSSMNRMLKNNAGYDLKQLFIGTEGSLGIVTRAVMRLFPAPTTRHTAFVALKQFDDVQALLILLRETLTDSLSAFEVLWNDYYRVVTADGGHRPPLERDYAFYVVFESEGHSAERDEALFDEALSTALQKGIIADAVIPKSGNERDAIWQVRENFEVILDNDPLFLYDVSLPIRHMAAYVEQINRNVTDEWPDAEVYTLGHAADGNLHPFVVPNNDSATKAVSDRCVYGPLADIGGSVSAEHGIGTDKISWMAKSRSPTEVALMRSLKTNLDPKGLLNPGRVLPD